MRQKVDPIKLIGMAATIIGMAASLLSNWVDQKQTEEMIDEKIEQAFAEHSSNEEES